MEVWRLCLLGQPRRRRRQGPESVRVPRRRDDERDEDGDADEDDSDAADWIMELIDAVRDLVLAAYGSFVTSRRPRDPAAERSAISVRVRSRY